ncbi:unnamed protein product [Rotaria sp. Silwood2]|nr:unnamed protein product [Rotaria sp. Silwood2]
MPFMMCFMFSLISGKAAKPRCFKNLDMAKLPITWRYNRTAWMNSTLFTNWLYEFDKMIQKQKRQIFLFLDNAPVHPPEIKLKNIAIKCFPANTTAVIQPMDQGIIRTFNAYCRKHLVQHIIANANGAYSSDYIVITVLYAVCWIDSAWKFITETILRNTFKEAGLDNAVVSPDSILIQTTFTNDDSVEQENKCLHELDNVLKHLTIDDDFISAADFVSADEDVPVFYQLNDASEKRLAVDGIANDDIPNGNDLDIEQPPSLS